MSARDGGPVYAPLFKLYADHEDAGRTALRDHFAGQALVGLFSAAAHPRSEGVPRREYEDMAEAAYSMADAMLRAREATS